MESIALFSMWYFDSLKDFCSFISICKSSRVILAFFVWEVDFMSLFVSFLLLLDNEQRYLSTFDFFFLLVLVVRLRNAKGFSFPLCTRPIDSGVNRQKSIRDNGVFAKSTKISRKSRPDAQALKISILTKRTARCKCFKMVAHQACGGSELFCELRFNWCLWF